MRKIDKPPLKTITLSQIEHLKKQGYEPLQGGDASKANSDYFMVMVRDKGDGTVRRVKIVCPSFLRGPLGFSATSEGVSY